ncbi:hypothetical protein AGABI2DRAFT_191307 [Agaricus bisporus var. bisporus H97]|uniref:hypothetical protein n=1 Tax=Agaricus bisporus var. bisporus (strain H97 / ATCC MYA-4626 / FGSC 10389) TaxID=936046 RepID=UPI00029F5A12|nr:hypothetical protein AGABI2DRAFT_191307 [Agaricus bisporus var. bisporus H97]EKV49232.1 hypothetical protein AGABI2DRAFT_191307 [Agaricus bisporus var. bisporus H97]
MAPRTTKHTPVFRTSYMEVSKLKYPNIQPRNDWDLALLASFTGSPSLTSNEKFYAYSDDEMRAQYHNLGLTDKEIKDGRARAEVIKQATEILDSPGTAVGLKPRPGDDDVHIRAIPNSDYSIRMWGTNMETNREYCFDFVETATGNPVNSPFEYQLWAVPNKRTPWLPCPSAQLHSLAYNFGYEQKDIPPGVEVFVLLEGTPCVLKRPGMRPVYFEAPVRPRSLDLPDFDELDFGIPS